MPLDNSSKAIGDIQSPVDVSIIVISYNTRDMTLACIESVMCQTKVRSFEVIVLDNASSDGSAVAVRERFPSIEIIENKDNLGFAAGNNAASKFTSGRYILLLNPDTLILNSAIDTVIDFADNNTGAGIYGARTVFADRTLNPPSCWRNPSIWGMLCRASGLSSLFKTSNVFNYDSYGSWQRDTVREVDIVSGCFLLIPRELWERLNGFDESFFMYGEDWDLCLRARRMGSRCLLCPDAEIIHYGGASEPVKADKLVRLLHSQSKLYRRHWGWFRRRVLSFLLYMWVLRGCFSIDTINILVNRPQTTSANIWREVWRRRDEWLYSDK